MASVDHTLDNGPYLPKHVTRGYRKHYSHVRATAVPVKPLVWLKLLRDHLDGRARAHQKIGKSSANMIAVLAIDCQVPDHHMWREHYHCVA